MGTRDRMAERCLPLLDDDAEIEFIFSARAAGYNAYRIIAVTSDAIVVLDNKFFGFRPKRVMRTLPRRTRIGKLSFFGGATSSLGEPLQIYPRWVPEARRADAALDDAPAQRD